jgi:hypothetical protein
MDQIIRFVSLARSGRFYLTDLCEQFEIIRGCDCGLRSADCGFVEGKARSPGTPVARDLRAQES